MKRFISTTHNEPTELEFYADRNRFVREQILGRSDASMKRRNGEFERARNVERMEWIDEINILYDGERSK